MDSRDRTHVVRLEEQALLLAKPFPGPFPLYMTKLAENLLVRCHVFRAFIAFWGEATVLVTLLCCEETLCLGQLL